MDNIKEIDEHIAEIKVLEKHIKGLESAKQGLLSDYQDAKLYLLQLKHELREIMQSHGKASYKISGVADAKIQRGKTAVVIENIDLIPTEYVEEVIERKPNKTRIKDDIELLGKEIPGVRLTRKPTITIKYKD